MRVPRFNELKSHQFSAYYAYLFLIGNCLIWYATSQLDWRIYLLALLIPLLIKYRNYRISLLLLLILLGSLYSEFHAFKQQWQFPESLISDNHLLTGEIEGLPEYKGDIVRFKFRVKSINRV